MKKRLIGFSMILLLIITTVFTGCSNQKSNTDASSQEQDNSTEELSDDIENKETTLYIVRHGKTFFNTTSQFQGFCDSPLTEKGITQATQVGKGLSDISFVTAYSSDLGRQRSTAKLILEENAEQIPDLVELYGLREWNYGSFEGRDEMEICAPMLKKYEFAEDGSDWDEFVKFMGNKKLADEYAAMDPEGLAENYDEITKRAQEAIDTIIEQTEALGGGNVLIVSSGSQISTILELLAPDQYNAESISNCSITIVKYVNGDVTLESINDTSHLENE